MRGGRNRRDDVRHAGQRGNSDSRVTDRHTIKLYRSSWRGLVDHARREVLYEQLEDRRNLDQEFVLRPRQVAEHLGLGEDRIGRLLRREGSGEDDGSGEVWIGEIGREARGTGGSNGDNLLVDSARVYDQEGTDVDADHRGYGGGLDAGSGVVCDELGVGEGFKEMQADLRQDRADRPITQRQDTTPLVMLLDNGMAIVEASPESNLRQRAVLPLKVALEVWNNYSGQLGTDSQSFPSSSFFSSTTTVGAVTTVVFLSSVTSFFFAASGFPTCSFPA